VRVDERHIGACEEACGTRSKSTRLVRAFYRERAGDGARPRAGESRAGAEINISRAIALAALN